MIKQALSPETMMIASDLRNAGFRVEDSGYGKVAISLTRKMTAMCHQVERALDAAGYDECQYSLNQVSSGAVYLKAVVG